MIQWFSMILIIHDGNIWEHINQYGITGLLWAWIDALPECWRVFGLLVQPWNGRVYCTASPWLLTWLLHGSFYQKQLNFTKRLQDSWNKMVWFVKTCENMWKLVSIPEYSEHSTGVCDQQEWLYERGQIFGHLAQPLSSSPKRGALSLRSVFGSRGMFDPVEFRSCQGALDFRAVHTLPRHDQEHHDRIRWAHCSVELKDVLLAAFKVFFFFKYRSFMTCMVSIHISKALRCTFHIFIQKLCWCDLYVVTFAFCGLTFALQHITWHVVESLRWFLSGDTQGFWMKPRRSLWTSKSGTGPELGLRRRLIVEFWLSYNQLITMKT